MTHEPIIQRWGDKRIVWYTDHVADQIPSILQNNLANGVGISPSRGYSHRSLQPLVCLKQFIKGLAVVDFNGLDFGAMAELTALEFLTVGGCNSPLDLTLLPLLTSLRLQWHKQIILPLPAHAHLKRLHLRDWKPKCNDITSLPCYQNLTLLSLTTSSIVNLNGISKLPSLLELQCSYLRRLNSIASLADSKVSNLVIENCRKITDYNALAECNLLKLLCINFNGSIKTISFINKMNSLVELRIVGTTVLDGQLEVCKKLKALAYTKRREYLPSEAELRESIAEVVVA
jgi:hypothetical protein